MLSFFYLDILFRIFILFNYYTFSLILSLLLYVASLAFTFIALLCSDKG